MPRLPVRILLFVSSYAPLIALFGIRRRDSLLELFVFEVVAVGSVCVLLGVVAVQRGYADTEIEVESWLPKDADTLGYVATYLIPLLSVDLGKFDDVLALAVFGLVLGILYCNSSLLYTNPMLNLFGYHLYDVKEQGGPTWTVLARRPHLNVARIETKRVGSTMLRLEK